MKEDPNKFLPEHICSSCILDLEASYRFKMNCESSDAILQTYVVTNNTSVSNCGSEEGTEDEEDSENEEYADESDLYNYKSSMYDENGDLITDETIKKEIEVIRVMILMSDEGVILIKL